MKLIIDIDENSYKTCKSLAPLTNNYIDTVIGNGIPYEERPQGEWVEKEETPASVSYYCSNCECVGLGVEHFCSWCGADMREAKNDI